jgi:hypothetical protein
LHAGFVAHSRGLSTQVPGVEAMKTGLLRRDVGGRPLLYGRMRPHISTALTGLVGAAAYYVSMRAGLALRSPPDNLAAFWPPATILLVGLLMTPPRRW